ncbi:MAG: CoA-binding protein [Deltaproteobacteria bacterium]
MKDIKEKEIAVVGVSSNREKYGYQIFSDLLNAGFRVQGVNPRLPDLLGRKIYPSLRDLPVKPDMVITVVPPDVTGSVTDQAIELGIKELWMQPGSESEAAVRKAREHGITVTYNACFMVANSVW